MKVATFNVNGVRGRLPNLLKWLQREQPDIACLQELKAAQKASPESASMPPGRSSAWLPAN
jgi:exodeoxyribonuclease-3